MGRAGQPSWPSQNKIIVLLIIIIITMMTIIIFCYKIGKSMTMLSGLNTKYYGTTMTMPYFFEIIKLTKRASLKITPHKSL